MEQKKRFTGSFDFLLENCIAEERKKIKLPKIIFC